MQSLSERLQEIMRTTGMSPADLSRAAKVTSAAVTFWLSGKTRSIKGATAAELEKTTGFRAAWIATGRGQKLLAPSEEGDMLLPREVELIVALRQLSEADQATHTAAILEAAARQRQAVEEALRRMGIDPATLPAQATLKSPRI